jgi:hypothetical protein
MNALTTGSATSASSSARRISRAVASISASVSLPLPRSFVKMPERRSLKVSNTAQLPVGQQRETPASLAARAARHRLRIRYVFAAASMRRWVRVPGATACFALP